MKYDSEIRAEIIKSAAKVFSQYGYKKTRMEDVAKTVGRGKSSLYYYFKNKDEVFKAVVEYEANILKYELIDSVAMGSDSLGKIKNYLLTRMKVYKRVDNFYKVLNYESLSHLTFVEDIRRAYAKQEITLLSSILSEGFEKKQINIKEPNLAAMAIVTALKGLETPLFNEPDQPMDERLNQLLEILFYGIASNAKD